MQNRCVMKGFAGVDYSGPCADWLPIRRCAVRAKNGADFMLAFEAGEGIFLSHGHSYDGSLPKTHEPCTSTHAIARNDRQRIDARPRAILTHGVSQRHVIPVAQIVMHIVRHCLHEGQIAHLCLAVFACRAMSIVVSHTLHVGRRAQMNLILCMQGE